MDTAAQLVRIAVLVVAVLIGRHWGFYGAVSGLVLAEFAGMTFMLEALFRRLKCFSLRQVFGNAAHLSISAVMLMVAGEMVRRIPLPFHAGSRTFVSAQLCIISLVVLALTWPAFVLTNYLTSEERTQAVKTLLPSRRLVVHRQQGS